MPFSFKGLVEQLEYEGYSHSDAAYGANRCGADWKEQAAKSAETYLAVMPFSRKELIEQLEYEGYTHEQAVYGAQSKRLLKAIKGAEKYAAPSFFAPASYTLAASSKISSS